VNVGAPEVPGGGAVGSRIAIVSCSGVAMLISSLLR
jgi:hypothetical protein